MSDRNPNQQQQQQQQQQQHSHQRSHSVDKNSDEGSYPGNDNNNESSSKNNKSSSTSNVNNRNDPNKPLAPPVLIYHESARSIVFRDHLRRAVNDATTDDNNNNNNRDKNQQPAPVTDKRTTNQPSPTAGGSNNNNQQQQEQQQAIIVGFTPKIVPLPSLDLGPNDIFQELLNSYYDCSSERNNSITTMRTNEFTEAEKEVVEMLHEQNCCVKTIKNTDWTDFLSRFQYPHKRSSKQSLHDDIPPQDNIRIFNSFVTSTTLLPPDGKRMRAYGSTTQYTTGVVFALPRVTDYDLYDYVGHDDGADESTLTTAFYCAEDAAVIATETWSWPAGYSAKTEFNIDSNGKLINGRQEALRNLSTLRKYNIDYCTKDTYIIANRIVSGISVIPYNEVFLRVGGYGRLVRGQDISILNKHNDSIDGTKETVPTIKRSFATGVGLPVALFVRTAKFGDLLSLLRTRARIQHILGEQHIKNIPLLLIDPDIGVRVLTDTLQNQLWKIASNTLNPFQNTTISHRTTVAHTDDNAFQQKVDELIQFDESIQTLLTPEELVRIAGGFGATDTSVASVFQQVYQQDHLHNKELRKQQSLHSAQQQQQQPPSEDEAPPPIDIVESHRLQDVVNEGLTAAVRAGDYHTSRQLLILYSLVASSRPDDDDDDDEEDDLDKEENFTGGPTTTDTENGGGNPGRTNGPPTANSDPNGAPARRRSSVAFENSNADAYKQLEKDMKLVRKKPNENKLSSNHLPAPPPPPPLDTDRLRSATNSDGLLAVLGAAEVLKAMRTGAAQRRTMEAVSAVEEWVDYGEQSMAFRISSWFDQRAAQGDLQIATESNTNFMAFVSNKAISNRKAFAQQLREAASQTDFTDVRFLLAVTTILSKMRSPCLRLELLQYILGLDNRYSVAHVQRSVELAATCLNMSASTVNNNNNNNPRPNTIFLN